MAGGSATAIAQHQRWNSAAPPGRSTYGMRPTRPGPPNGPRQNVRHGRSPAQLSLLARPDHFVVRHVLTITSLPLLLIVAGFRCDRVRIPEHADKQLSRFDVFQLRLRRHQPGASK